MTDLPSRIQDILEGQQVDSVSAEDGQARILGIAKTRDKIMEAVSQAIVETDIISVRQRRDLVQFLRSLRRPDAAPAREIQQQIDAAVDAERKRCAEIVQLARHDEIDRDFRSIIHRIEDAWDPARLEDEKAELKEGK